MALQDRMVEAEPWKLLSNLRENVMEKEAENSGQPPDDVVVDYPASSKNMTNEAKWRFTKP